MNAKPNDLIYISGTLGKGRKGLTDWQNNKKSEYISDFFRPKARFDIAEYISNFASSCIDVSDGLIKDLSSICKLSKVGAIIKFEDIPITNDIKDLLMAMTMSYVLLVERSMRIFLMLKVSSLLEK